MNKKICFTLLVLVTTISSYAQQTDGKTKSLIKAEKELEKSIAKLGGAVGLAEFSSGTATIFTPNPQVAKTYLASNKEAFNDLKRSVNYANISKSGDWGVTSGQYQMKNDKTPVFGDYLTVWKVDGPEGVWRIEADIETEHQKTDTKIAEKFIEASSKVSEKSSGLVNTSQAAKIVSTTEATFAIMLKTYGMAAFSEFASDDVRLLYPSNDPIIGKDKLIHLLGKMVSTMELKGSKVDISKSGDMAFTYGTAAFEYKINLKESLNYLAIWELQEGHKWNMTYLVFTPAER